MKIIYQWVWHGILDSSQNLVSQRSVYHGRIPYGSAHPCKIFASIISTHPKFEAVWCFIIMVLNQEEFVKERYLLEIGLALYVSSIFIIIVQEIIHENLGVRFF